MNRKYQRILDMTDTERQALIGTTLDSATKYDWLDFYPVSNDDETIHEILDCQDSANDERFRRLELTNHTNWFSYLRPYREEVEASTELLDFVTDNPFENAD
jgi:hypothetical protein